MPSKVNTKFVVGLSAVLLVAVAGMAYTAYTLVNNSATDLIKAGDARLAEGKVSDAVSLYSKAVNKEKTNVEFIRKWIEAMEQSTPENQLKYEKQYLEYMAAVRQLATVEPEKVENQRKFLGTQFGILRNTRFDEGNFTAFANEVESLLRTFDGKPSGEWEMLRRYRGMINSRRYQSSSSPDAKMRDAAVEDLKAAIKADRSDSESAIALADLYASQAQKVAATDPAESAKLTAQVDQTLANFLAGSPDDPSALIAQLQFDLAKTRLAISQNAQPAELDRIGQQFLERNKPVLERAFAKAKTLPMPVSDSVIRLIQIAESLVDAQSRLARTEELIRECLKANPSSATHMLLLAELAKQRGDYTTAVEQLDKVTKLPDLPISVEGSMLFGQRRAALVQQALWSVRAWQLMPVGAEKDAALERTKELRGRAASTVGADDPRMLLVDAQLAFIANTPEEVQRSARLLDEYNRKTERSDTEALLLTAQVAVQRNQPGLARDTLNRLLQIQPNSVTAIMALAELERNFQNYAGAKGYFIQALRLSPGNEAAQRALTALEILEDPSKATDPIIGELSKVNQLQERLRDKPGANAQILEALKPLAERFKHDPRVALPLAQAFLVNQQRNLALQTLEKSIAANPENEFIKRQLASLKIDDPVQRQLMMIDDSSLADVEKLLSKQQVFRTSGRTDEANASLAEAIKLAPNDRRVVEAQFIDHIERGDIAGARPLSERAVRENLDGFNGDTYRARLLASEGKSAEGAALLKGIVDRGGAQPEVFRLMGRMMVLDSRLSEAIEAYREAMKLRPNDVQGVIDLINTLAAAGRSAEALEIARKARTFAENDLRFQKLWLTLEAQAGDRDLAIRQREQLAASLASDRENILALTSLYLETNQIEKARVLIDKTRATNDDLEFAAMDATLLWGIGKIPEAKKAFQDAIAKFNIPATTRPEMAYSRFLRERGDTKESLEALNRARPLQDPKVMEIDRAVSDMGSSIGAADLAEAGARQVVEGNADTPNNFYQKRIVESLLSRNKVAEAEVEVAKLPSGAAADASSMILVADVARFKGDAKRTMEVLNEAVTRFPKEPVVFMRRGEVLMSDKSTVRDAIEDFSRVIELQPDNTIGYRLRAQAYERLDDKRKAEDDLRSAIRVAPNDDRTIFGFMSDLTAAAREEEADQLAREVIKSRAKDVRFMMAVSQFFRQRERLDVAARWCREAFAIDQSDQIAVTYLANLLDIPRPDTAEAQRVLTVLAERTRNNPIYMMANAKISYSQNRTAEALKTAQDAIKLLDSQNQIAMDSWFLDMSRMMTDKAQLRQVLINFANQGVVPEWMAYYRASSLLSEPATRTEGASVLEQLVGSAKIPALRRLVHNRRGEFQYGLGQYQPAADAWKLGVQEFPQDYSMVNNLAYTLTKHLSKHDDALPLAEAAAKALPEQADVLDTLGVVYLNLNRNEDAGKVLEQAGRLARNPISSLTIASHYIEALRRLNKIQEAKDFVARISDMYDANKEELPAEVRAQWDAHRDSLK